MLIFPHGVTACTVQVRNLATQGQRHGGAIRRSPSPHRPVIHNLLGETELSGIAET